MTAAKKQPNFFEVLDLDPSVDDWSVIEERIRKKKQQWSRDLSTGIPAKGRRAGLYQSLLPDITAVMKDSAKRKAEAQRFRELKQKDRKEKKEDLARLIEVLSASGSTITDKQFRTRVVKEYGQFFSEDELRERLRKAGLSIGTPKAKKAAPKARTLEPARARAIQENLTTLHKTSLYDFLGLRPQTSPQLLHNRAKEQYQDITRIGRTGAEAQAHKDLCGDAMKVFHDEESKERYDNTLAYEALGRMKGSIDAAGEDRVIMPKEMEALIRNARAIGVSAQLARDYIEDQANRRRWQIIGDETEAERVHTCGLCGAVARKVDQKNCHECGEPLLMDCPFCGRPTPTEDAACAQCGTHTGDAPVVKVLLEEGRRHVRHHRLREGREHFERALSYWPGWKEAERARDEVDQLLKAREQELAALDQTIAAGRLFEAETETARLGRKYGTSQVDAQRKKIRRGICRAEEAFARAEEARRDGDEDRCFTLLEKVLATASDHPQAKKVLAAMPPPAPRRLSVEPLRRGFRLSWIAVRAAGRVRYRVLRKTGGAPLHHEDGTVVADTRATEVDDVGAESGRPWFYAVYAIRAEVPSATAASDGPWLLAADIDDLELLPGPGEVVLSWRRPHGCRKVRVARAAGSPPDRLAAGTAVDTSSNGAHDTGLENGRDYGYLVVAVYDDPSHAGRETLSAGLRRSAQPVAPPAAVDDLASSRDGKTVSLRWSAIDDATVEIRASRSEPRHRPGSWLAVEQLDQLGKAVARTGSNSAETNLDVQGRFYFVPVSVKRGIAVIGRPEIVTTIDDVSGLRCQSSGNHLVLTWSWPQGIDEVMVACSNSRDPEGPEDPRSIRRRVTRREYDRAGCWELRNVEKKPHYFRVYSKGPGIDAYSGGAAVFESRGRSRKARFEVVLERSLGGLKIGPVKSAALQVTSDEVDRLSDLLLVVKKDQVPMSPKDGQVVKRLQELELTEGAASVPVPASHLGAKRYAKLFFADIAAHPDVRLMPASKNKLRLG